MLLGLTPCQISERTLPPPPSAMTLLLPPSSPEILRIHRGSPWAPRLAPPCLRLSRLGQFCIELLVCVCHDYLQFVTCIVRTQESSMYHPLESPAHEVAAWVIDPLWSFPRSSLGHDESEIHVLIKTRTKTRTARYTAPHSRSCRPRILPIRAKAQT